MNNKRLWRFIAAMFVTLALLIAASTVIAGTLAQGPGDNEDSPAAGNSPDAPLTAVGTTIPVQGRLTDASGNPIQGTRAITYALYSTSVGGTPLCIDPDTVTFDNGLFNGLFDSCTDADIDGRPLYLGITVVGEPAEMTPRRAILPVPYARSLRPGAIISNTSSAPIVNVFNYGTGTALYARTESDDKTVGAVFGSSYGGAPGVLGENHSLGGHGVIGRAGAFGAGVYAEGNALAYGAWITSSNIVLYVTSPSENATNAILVDGGYDSEYDFRVTNAGFAYADGGWNGAADFAELIATDNPADKYEFGDVLVISPDQDRAVTLSNKAYSTAVIGVYSEKPGFVGSTHPMDSALSNELPVAVVGIVLVKVSAENGPIQRGDLLVTSNTPGHAAKALEFHPGTILGKAMGELKSGTGLIPVLISLQ